MHHGPWHVAAPPPSRRCTPCRIISLRLPRIWYYSFHGRSFRLADGGFRRDIWRRVLDEWGQPVVCGVEEANIRVRVRARGCVVFEATVGPLDLLPERCWYARKRIHLLPFSSAKLPHAWCNNRASPAPPQVRNCNERQEKWDESEKNAKETGVGWACCSWPLEQRMGTCCPLSFSAWPIGQ